jgi:hypothetical protein
MSHKLNVLTLARTNALARIRNVGDNIADAKENLRLSVLNHGTGSKAWNFWKSELARHDSEWTEVCNELREIDWELGNK